MLTRKQKMLYGMIKELVKETGRFPTIKEISFLSGIQEPSSVSQYLDHLFVKGYITKESFGYQLTNPAYTIPLVAYVPAGSPSEVFNLLGEELELPEWMIDKSKETVGFKVRGNSMIDAHIQDGDIVIVKKTETAQAGEMVVAHLQDGTITLKRLRQTGDKYWLSPENDSYDPIKDPFQVIGIVIGVLRKYD